MPAKTEVPINGKVLQWAIEEGGWTLAEFAKETRFDESLLRAWIAERELPGKTEFSALVDKLRRPSALFFLPEPPREDGLPPQFRTAPGQKSRKVLPRERFQIRWARYLQAAASEVLREVTRQPARILRVDREMSPSTAASLFRAQLAVSVEDQLYFSEPGDAFGLWRAALESHGVFVLHLSLKENGLRGFSIWDEYAPFAGVNSSYSFQSRTYSLAHEAAHLAARSESACADGFAMKGFERWCDEFAAALLMPADVVETIVADETDMPKAATRLAKAFGVSFSAAIIRLVELDLADRGLRALLPKGSDRKRKTKGGPHIDRVDRRIGELGERLPRVLLGGIQKDVLTSDEVSEYLRVGYSELGDLESRLGRRIPT